jgi:hypothetical protein
MLDLVLMTTVAAQHDQLSASQCAEMIMELPASIRRQHQNVGTSPANCSR